MKVESVIVIEKQGFKVEVTAFESFVQVEKGVSESEYLFFNYY